jgi:hypothetical protein
MCYLLLCAYSCCIQTVAVTVTDHGRQSDVCDKRKYLQEQHWTLSKLLTSVYIQVPGLGLGANRLPAAGRDVATDRGLARSSLNRDSP